MTSLIMIFLVIPSALAQTPDAIPKVDVEDVTYIASVRDGKTLFATRLTMGTFASNSVGSIVETLGSEWREEFFRYPETVAAYQGFLHLTGQEETYENLWHGSTKGKRPESPLTTPAAIAKLNDQHLETRLEVGPYVLITIEKEIWGRRASIPSALRKEASAYRLVTGFNFTSTLSWLITLATAKEKPESAQQVTDFDASEMIAFEFTAVQPEHDEDVVGLQSRWLESADETPSSGKAYLFLRKVFADSEHGYGRPLLEIAGDPSLAPDLPSKQLASLVAPLFAAESLEDHFAVWHEDMHDQLRPEYERRRSAGVPEDSAIRGFLTRSLAGTPNRAGRLLATVDCGVGYVHFVINPGQPLLKSEPKVITIAHVLVAGKPRLALSLGVIDYHSAAMFQALAQHEFHECLNMYVKARYPMAHDLAWEKEE